MKRDYSQLNDKPVNDKDKTLFDQFPSVTRKEWEENALRDLKGTDLGRLKWKTYEGFELEPIYFLEDLGSASYLADSLPGEFPFARGTRKLNNRWEVCEWINDQNVSEANKNSLSAIDNGVDTITFQCRFSENGVSGIPVQGLRDMESLLEGIPLDTASVNFHPGIAGPELYSLFLAGVNSRGFPLNDLKGNIYYDPLRELAVKGELGTTLDDEYRKMASLVTYAASKTPDYRTVCVDSGEFHESGANLVQELAFTVAKGVEYLVQLTGAGIDTDTAASNMCFSFPVGSNYFTEVAKFRAARVLWAKLVNEFSPTSDDTMEMVIHARTGLWNKTIYDPYVNMIRTTVEAIIASVAGCNSISVGPMNQTYEQPGEFTRRMARNTQHIIREESYLGRVIDPASGSYYVENLTGIMLEESFNKFLEIERKGGYTQCLKDGIIQEEISSVREKKNKDIRKRRLVLLGTNQYPNSAETMLDMVQDIDKTSELVLSGRSVDRETAGAPDRLADAFTGDGINIGDIIGGRKSKTGISVKKIEQYRGAEIFERIRFNTERYTGGDEDRRPKVFLLKFGNLASRNARASFSANFFGCAGFEVIEDLGYDNINDGIVPALESGAEIVVLCSSDGEYGNINEYDIIPLANADKKLTVVVAGNPESETERLRGAGVNDFIHLGSNAADMLINYQKILGIISS